MQANNDNHLALTFEEVLETCKRIVSQPYTPPPPQSIERLNARKEIAHGKYQSFVERYYPNGNKFNL
ncbi:MAG: hypothetical protein DI551_02355 [Micavibrio aeruginosavorus]|uniref:Uncharacterized protein n=1 Tax=Micavibrio aeruginosavorus TaxID=349221 RepID=A0A2W5PTH3_9BACT|nr:MAG: hypothetical protein DI551_02355 [Micavibrio aeruginosavorus]